MAHDMKFPFTRTHSPDGRLTYDRMLDAADIMKEFGVKKWPDTAMEARTICGSTVWVNAKTRKRMEMRVFTYCPGCGRQIAVGKLAQHMRMMKRKEAGLPTGRGGY